MKELIEAQKTYIEYLERHVSDMASFMRTHRQEISEEEYVQGVHLRQKIEQLTNALTT